MNAKLQQIVNANVNGATFVGIDTTTDVTLRGGKKNPLQGKVVKRTIGSNVVICQNKSGSSYVNIVRKRLQKEGIDPNLFEPGESKWGTRIPETPFIEHKGKIYLEVVFIKSGSVINYVNGKVTPTDEIEGYPQVRHPHTQEMLTNKVVLRRYSVDSIDRITIGGKTFIKGKDY